MTPDLAPEAQGMVDQMRTVWSSLLAAMTQEGATRGDIIAVTVATALVIVGVTAENLWEETAAPPEEEDTAARTLRSVLHTLHSYVAAQGD